MNKYITLMIILAICLATQLSAEQVCKLSYTGVPEDLDGQNIEIPSNAVFMSEKVHVGQPTEIIEGTIDTTQPLSILFLIDHSGSMFLKNFTQNGTNQQARDRWGARFRVTSDLLDTIQEVYPECEFGLSVFRTNLYFNPKDDNLFADMSKNIVENATWELGDGGFGSTIDSNSVSEGVEFDITIAGQTSTMLNNDQWPWASATAYFDATFEGVTHVVIEYQSIGADMVITLPQEPLSDAGEEYMVVKGQSSSWRVDSIPIASFAQPDWVTNSTPYDPSKVSSISFSPDVTNDASGASSRIKIKSIQLVGDKKYGGGYIPLLKLKDNYSYKNGSKTGTGYDVLKHYLDTTKSTVPNTSDDYVNLQYAPSDPLLEPWGTNITAGFDAVKDAFKNSSVPKDRQYVIFLSDGEATEPQSDAAEKMRFLEGEDVPTLFTIFFSPDGTIPQDIDSLTKVVKNNGYSSSNTQSAAWSIQADYETLKSTLLENVFSIINTKSVSKPMEVTVNGKKPDGDPVEVGEEFIYTFSSAFPFTGVENDFNYEINYKISVQDTAKGTIDSTKDTTINSEFTIKLTEGATLPENFELSCWNREIEFYHNGTRIYKANETMDSIEVRFIPSEGDTFYTYSNVKLDLTNSGSGGSGDNDLETISLAEPDTFFSATIAIPIAETDKGDGILQVNDFDEIIAIFRNPLLPLDTLRDTLPFELSGTISLGSAAYFDKIGPDGEEGTDGFIDSIFIELSSDGGLKIDPEDLDQLIEKLELPSDRKFEILDTTLASTGIALNVRENTSACNTAVDEENDSIKISEVILEHGGWVTLSKVLPEDRMAPVIISARVHQFEEDSLIDSLIVEFSEPVREIFHDEPFLFMNPGSWYGEYTVNVSYLDNEDGGIRHFFSIENIEIQPIVNRGDSIWINHDYGNGYYITDTSEFANEQDAENNIRREFSSVIYEEKPFDMELKVVGPYDPNDPNDGNKISPLIIDILNEENLDELDGNEEDGEYHGMLIAGETVEGEDADITMSGTIKIYDCLGNSISDEKEMSFSDQLNSIFYVWNGRNMGGRVVGSGAYLAILRIQTVSNVTGDTIKDLEYKKFLVMKQ